MKVKCSIGYKRKVLYQNIELEIPDQGIISVIGDNGSGKSTLCKTLAGVLKPITGKISKNITDSVAIVSDYVTIPDETKVDDILKLLGSKSRFFSVNNYTALFAFVKHLSDKYIKCLSSGERRLVEIFCALSIGKKIIILDEAASSLDFKNKSLLLSYVKSISNCGVTIIHVSHDFDDIVYLGGMVKCLFKDQKKIENYQGVLTADELKKHMKVGLLYE